MENRWAKAAAEGKTVEIEIEIDIIYSGNSKRPDKFIVTETIDGVESPQPQIFNNMAGG